jgi:hypothetical protein
LLLLNLCGFTIGDDVATRGKMLLTSCITTAGFRRVQTPIAKKGNFDFRNAKAPSFSRYTPPIVYPNVARVPDLCPPNLLTLLAHTDTIALSRSFAATMIETRTILHNTGKPFGDAPSKKMR